MVMFIEISDAATRCPCFLMSTTEPGLHRGATAGPELCRLGDSVLGLRLCRKPDYFSLFLPDDFLISWDCPSTCGN